MTGCVIFSIKRGYTVDMSNSKSKFTTATGKIKEESGVTKKVTTSKKATTYSKMFSRKKTASKHTVKKNNTKSITTTQKTSLGKNGTVNKTLSTKRIVPLAILNPFRFPITLETLAIQTARIGGMAVLVAGGIFTTLYSQYIWNISTTGILTSQSATVVLNCDIAEGMTAFQDCIEHNIDLELSDTTKEFDSGEGVAYSKSISKSITTIDDDAIKTYTTTTAKTLGGGIADAQATATATGRGDTQISFSISKSITNPQPPATFLIKAPEPLTGLVPIYISVASADIVEVVIFQESYTSPIPLGRAEQIQENIWKYQWDTTQFEDGSYKIAADITNSYNPITNPYRNTDSKYLIVSNSLQSETDIESSPSQTKPETKQSNITAVASPDMPEVISITLTATGMTGATLYATHLASGSINVIGEVRNISDNQWNYTWDTSEYIAGDYELQARIKTVNTTYQSSVVTVSVGNDTENTLLKDAPLRDMFSPELTDIGFTDIQANQTSEIPQPAMSIDAEDILSGIIDITVRIPDTTFVELWVLPEGATTPQIVGLANKSFVKKDIWEFTWNTRKVPNGSYLLYPRVKNSYGTYEGKSKAINVFNQPFEQSLSAEQQEQEMKINRAQELTIKFDNYNDELMQDNASIKDDQRDNVVSSNNLEIEEKSQDTQAEILALEFSDTLDEELQRLVTAYRSDDPIVIDRAEQRLKEFKKQVVLNVSDTTSSEMADDVLQVIEKEITEKKQRAKKVQKIITERVGSEVFKDSDSDGITDYDERVLYKTDPYSADTDKDGFNDGIEIAGGYNPLDSTKEAVRVFESPKEKGIVRDDILVVESITPIILEDPKKDTDGVNAQAVITGRALPNSYVTLYIFSLPTVVTVKTEADGSWQYRFDKELEDGEHEIYVGVTDNAGRIVAKSAAFKFVKEAQAFTPEDAAVLGAVTSTSNTDDRLLSTFMIYLILSISVVSIGLVLILLGLHLDNRRKLSNEVLRTDE